MGGRLVAVREDEGAQALAVRDLPIEARADVGRDARLPRLQDERAHAARRRALRLQPFMDVTLDGVQHQRLQLSGLAADAQAARGVVRQIVLQALRSEEHTSELQSLMRTSYAVF